MLLFCCSFFVVVAYLRFGYGWRVKFCSLLFCCLCCSLLLAVVCLCLLLRCWYCLIFVVLFLVSLLLLCWVVAG